MSKGRKAGMMLVDVPIVDAACWCEAKIVRIPRSWVGAKTRGCGKLNCRAPRDMKWTETGERIIAA